MFKIVASPTFTCPVRLSRPGDEVPSSLIVTFKHKGSRDLARWLRAAKDTESDAEYLAEVIDGWSGVVGDDDKPVPFSRAALEQMLDEFPAAGAELVIAYRRQLADARAKN
jgi:hypothetical protein